MSAAGGVSPDSFLFLSGAKNASYDHVWTSVTKVDLVGPAGQTTTVYNGTSSGGQVIDLQSLNGASGQQFLLLTGFTAPAGSFTGANITVSSKLSTVPKGSSNAVTASYAGSSGSSTVLSAKFASPQNLFSTKNIVVSFNLAGWTLSGATVSAPNGQFVQCGPANGPFIPGNLVGAAYVGTVSNLAGTSPTLTFSLGQGPCVINVATSSSTTVSNSDGSANPALANGATVAVVGTFDPTTNAIDASSIVVQIGVLPAPPAFVSGLVTAASSTSNTITVTVNGCGGFEPPSTVLTMDITPSTTFVDASRATVSEAQFFGDLTLGTSLIQATGTISGSVLTAASVQFGAFTGGGSGGGPNPLIKAANGPKHG